MKPQELLISDESSTAVFASYPSGEEFDPSAQLTAKLMHRKQCRICPSEHCSGVTLSKLKDEHGAIVDNVIAYGDTPNTFNKDGDALCVK